MLFDGGRIDRFVALEHAVHAVQVTLEHGDARLRAQHADFAQAFRAVAGEGREADAPLVLLVDVLPEHAEVGDDVEARPVADEKLAVAVEDAAARRGHLDDARALNVELLVEIRRADQLPPDEAAEDVEQRQREEPAGHEDAPERDAVVAAALDQIVGKAVRGVRMTFSIGRFLPAHGTTTPRSRRTAERAQQRERQPGQPGRGEGRERRADAGLGKERPGGKFRGN